MFSRHRSVKRFRRVGDSFQFFLRVPATSVCSPKLRTLGEGDTFGEVNIDDCLTFPTLERLLLNVAPTDVIRLAPVNTGYTKHRRGECWLKKFFFRSRQATTLISNRQYWWAGPIRAETRGHGKAYFSERVDTAFARMGGLRWDNVSLMARNFAQDRSAELTTIHGGTKVPVLFLIHSRPDTSARVFDAIRAYAPPRLYVAADGPRQGIDGEVQLCEKARAIAVEVTWECEVKTLFHKDNQGLSVAAGSALDWFFANEEMGIFLEDDTVPNESFWGFSQDLLHRYKDNERIGFICGSNHANYVPVDGSSYFYSNLPTYGWGLALWRRTWDGTEKVDSDVFKNHHDLWGRLMKSQKFKAYWLWALRKLDSGEWSSFHWALYLSTVARGGLVAFPATNLVENVGFSAEATHTKSKPWRISNEVAELGPDLSHPSDAVPDQEFSKIYHERLLPERRKWVTSARRVVSKIGLIFQRFLTR